MDPDSLDMLMFLRANKELWPDARAMQVFLDLLTADEGAEADLLDERGGEQALEGR